MGKNKLEKYKESKLFKSCFKICCVLFLIFSIAALLNAFFPFELPPANEGSSTLVVASHGEPLRAFADEKGIWRYPITAETVSPLYIEALINYEDRFFRIHPGVNPVALVRAAWQWLYHGKIISGGSTLTMQVARFLEPRPQSVFGKLCQMIRAFQLEMNYSKTEILNYYLNHAPFGGPIEGVQAASFVYLGKSATELSHAEAALLAVLPQAPSRLRPDRHPDRASKAGNKVLKRMADLGIWSENIVDQAQIERFAAQFFAFPMSAPLLARRLKNDIKPGTCRPTTIDFHLQKTLEQRLSAFAVELPRHTSIAIIVIENRSLAVRAYVGSVDFLDSERFGHVDMVRAIRSPGSTLKPFLYGFAFEDGLIHSHSLLSDAPVSFGGYQPANFTGGYSGPVSSTEALQRSLNVPAVQLLEQIGPDVFFTRLRQGGLHLFFPKNTGPNLSMILGGTGTRLESLAAAFTCFARKGLSGKLRFFEDEPLKNRYMMSEEAAWMVRNILENNPGPGYKYKIFAIPEHRKIAWKTGTSYGFRDAWAIGSNNSYTAGVWAGRPDGTPIPGHYGAITAAPILFSIFDSILNKNIGKSTPRPDNIVSQDICWPLGLALIPEKEHLCHVKHTAWVIDSVIPPTFADRNQKIWTSPVAAIWINPETGKQVNSDCPVSRKILKEIPRWPVVLESWLSAELRQKSSLPIMDPVCGTNPAPEPGTIKLTGLSSGNTLQRAGALNNAPKVDLSVIGARHKVFWLINGDLTQVTSPEEIFAYRFDLPGQYEITVMDTHGNFDSVDIRVLD